jgi:MraZ protein
VLTRGSDRCVAAYPLDEWRRYELEYAKLNQYDEQSRFFLRTVLAWSEEVELDGQQRIMVPKKYLDFAGIDGKVVIVGMIDHIELWQPEEFEIYLSKSEASYEQVASQVMQRPNGQ